MSNINWGQSVIGHTISTNQAQSGGTSSPTQATGSSFFLVVSYDNTKTLSGVTDSFSNTYVQIGATIPRAANNLARFLCTNGAGGAAHNFYANFTTAPTCTVAGVEILNGALSGLLDQSNTNSGFLTAPITTNNITITPPATGELVIVTYWSSDFAVITFSDDNAGSSPFSFSPLVSQLVGNTGLWILCVEAFVATASGTFHGHPSDGGSSSNMSATIDSFLGATGGGISLAWIT